MQTEYAVRDQVFRALSDPTRRAVYERLAAAEATVNELTENFAVSQPAISQHLKTLREAGLVEARREGRTAHYHADPKGLAPLIDWLGHYENFWREHGEKLKMLLKDMPE
jgi:DNA-binding transcriptional ArsR family regulator